MFLDNGSLYHSLDTTHSLDRLSSAWDAPIRSTGCRLNGTSVEYVGAGQFTRQLICYMREGQNPNRYDTYSL